MRSTESRMSYSSKMVSKTADFILGRQSHRTLDKIVFLSQKLTWRCPPSMINSQRLLFSYTQCLLLAPISLMPSIPWLLLLVPLADLLLFNFKLERTINSGLQLHPTSFLLARYKEKDWGVCPATSRTTMGLSFFLSLRLPTLGLWDFNLAIQPLLQKANTRFSLILQEWCSSPVPCPNLVNPFFSY